MSQQEKVVPKFSSFKPKAREQQPDAESSKAPERHASSSQYQASGRHHEHRRRDREDRSTSHERSRKHRHRNHWQVQANDAFEQSESSRGTPLAREELEESDLFIIDRRGDVKNVEYGSLHRYSIPMYHRSGYGHVLGATTKMKIDRDSSTDKKIVLEPVSVFDNRRSKTQLTAKYRTPDSRTLRFVVPISIETNNDLDLDFLEFRPNLKRKRGSESPDAERHEHDYRTIQGEVKVREQPEDNDLEFDSDPDLHDESIAERQVRDHNTFLARRVKEEPTNVDHWLGLAEHQSAVVQPGTDIFTVGASDRRSIAEVRISVYDRALRHISKGNRGHDRLLLERLQEGSMIWESSKVTAQWEEALRACPKSILLWNNYIDFAQTNHSSFHYERCRATYLQYFKVLHSIHLAAKESERTSIRNTFIYMVLRFTSFTRDAGYEELAYATWQALLEYQLFRPKGLDEQKAQIESLETFWERDTPRIGEMNSLGWSEFVKGTSSDARALMVPSPASHIPSTVLDFAKIEASAMKRLQLPAGLDDESAVDDPYRQVMFSDIRPVAECFLVGIPTRRLVNAFLCFMQLPALPGEAELSTSDLYWNDIFLGLESPRTVLNHESLHTPTEEGFEMPNIQQTTSALFHDSFSGLYARPAGEEEEDSLLRFADRVLKAVVTAEIQDEILAEYYMAFKAEYFPSEAQKTAKYLSKTRPSSLRLYNAYALMEARCGRLAKANEVWSAALQMAPSLSMDSKDDAIMLQHDRMVSFIRNGDETLALNALVSNFTDDSSSKFVRSHISAVSRLKATQAFEEGFYQMCAKQKLYHAVFFVDCLAWLEYLSDAHSLDPVLEVFKLYMYKLSVETNPAILELLHQCEARIFKVHVEHKRPYKPRLLRQRLLEGIRTFPDNSIFLSLHGQLGPHNLLDDRLRDTVQKSAVDGTTGGVGRWYFILSEEIRRAGRVGFTSTHHSVRSLFNTALLTPDSSVNYAQALWTLWLRFELYVASQNSGSPPDYHYVKQVFFGGMRLLSWSKAWLVLGLRHLSQGALPQKELEKIYGVLEEKEFRIRVSLNVPGHADPEA